MLFISVTFSHWFGLKRSPGEHCVKKRYPRPLREQRMDYRVVMPGSLPTGSINLQHCAVIVGRSTVLFCRIVVLVNLTRSSFCLRLSFRNMWRSFLVSRSLAVYGEYRLLIFFDPWLLGISDVIINVVEDMTERQHLAATRGYDAKYLVKGLFTDHAALSIAFLLDPPLNFVS